MKGTQLLYGQVSGHHLLYLALGKPQIWVGREGDALAIAGMHSGWGFCWCQPKVIPHMAHGHMHFQVTHRRCADMSDEAFDALERPNTGRAVDQDGDVYPAGDHP